MQTRSVPVTGLSKRHRVRWLHCDTQPGSRMDVMFMQLLFAHSIPGHSRPMGRPQLTGMDTSTPPCMTRAA